MRVRIYFGVKVVRICCWMGCVCEEKRGVENIFRDLWMYNKSRSISRIGGIKLEL